MEGERKDEEKLRIISNVSLSIPSLSDDSITRWDPIEVSERGLKLQKRGEETRYQGEEKLRNE